MYKVLLEERARKDLDALDRVIYKRIIERILILQSRTRPQGTKKLEGSKNAWRLRVGDWRILYEISDARKEVKIYRIMHRSKAY